MGESQKGCFKKTNHAKFPKTNIFYSLCTCALCVSGGKKSSFLGKFGVLCFLKTPIFRFALCLIIDVSM